LVEAVLAHGTDSEYSDKMAVAFKNTIISYSELCMQIKAVAYKLHNEYGIGQKDIVMLSAMSKPEYVVVLLGIQYLGAISVPLDKKSKEQNIVDVYNCINPKLLLTDSVIHNIEKVSLRNFYDEAVELCSREDVNTDIEYKLPEEDELVAEMLFTTGTTGTPKGAMLTYGNIYASIHNTWNGVGMLPSDIVLIPLPLNHSVGMRVLRTALYIGAGVVIQNGFTFAKELERNLTDFACTALVSVPASIDLVMRQMQDKFTEILGRLRYIEFGAGSLSYDMKKKLVAMLPNTTIFNTWGSTETGGAIFLNVSARPDKYTSLGKPVDGIELKVVDNDGNAIEARDIDTAGRMVLRGPMQMAGYYNMPEENAKTLVDGWLYTNDLVYLDEEGFVYMLGRADSIINVGGEKVSPIEVENIAQEYEGIRECGCIGVSDPDETLGFVPVLYIVTEKEQINLDDFKKYLASRMEAYKLPHRFIVLDELPRNRMQKLDYKALRRLWDENGDENLMNPVVQNIMNRHSVRNFTDEPIPHAKLEMIVKSGIYAPTGHNMQTWKFTVIQDAAKINQFKEVVQRASQENNVYCYGFNNPNAIILVSNDRRNGNCIQDSSCAAENMMLAALSYGIGSVWLNPLKSISDVPEVRELLTEYGIPQTHIVWSTIAMGYPDGEPKYPARKMGVVQWI
jgi:long-chain acyl-CoA synthetase